MITFKYFHTINKILKKSDSCLHCFHCVFVELVFTIERIVQLTYKLITASRRHYRALWEGNYYKHLLKLEGLIPLIQGHKEVNIQ